MNVEAEEETKAEEETNTEEETASTTIVKGKKADDEDGDAPNYRANIATRIVAAHTEVLNASPKDLGTKTLPLLKICRKAAP